VVWKSRSCACNDVESAFRRPLIRRRQAVSPPYLVLVGGHSMDLAVAEHDFRRFVTFPA
jgi:hypothetical protein